MLRPPIRTWPASGSSKPAIMRRIVVLPQPLGPSNAIVSPAATVKEMSAMAVTAPKRLVTWLNSTVAVIGLSSRAEQALAEDPVEADERSRRMIRSTVRPISRTAAAAMERSNAARMLLISVTGSVVAEGSLRNRLTETSSIEIAKVKIAPVMMPVRISGSVTLQNAWRSVAPSTSAASVSVVS